MFGSGAKKPHVDQAPGCRDLCQALPAKGKAAFGPRRRQPFAIFQHRLVALTDVLIDCQVQGPTRLTSFRAPWLLLNGSLVHAFWIDGITPSA